MHEIDNEHCVSVHFGAALICSFKQTTDNFDDCDVNHSCIKTMSHSQKAAIIGIKPWCT